jgi:hypothetical protein
MQRISKYRDLALIIQGEPSFGCLEFYDVSFAEADSV